MEAWRGGAGLILSFGVDSYDQGGGEVHWKKSCTGFAGANNGVAA
jgi:hypothetical protein